MSEYIERKKYIKYVDDNFDKKVILKAKNNYIRYKFFKMPKFIFLMIVIFVFYYLIREKYSFILIELNLWYIVNIITIILSIIAFMLSFSEICLKNNKIIIKNKLKRDIEFDINKYPRIFTAKTYNVEYSYIHKNRYKANSYYIYFQEGEKSEGIRLDSNNIKKIISFLNCLEVTDIDDSPDIVADSSDNNQEKVIKEYFKNNEEKRVIGVKNKKQVIRFKESNPLVVVILIINFFIIIGFCSYLNKLLMDKNDLIILIMEFLIIMIDVLSAISEYEKTFTKISYTEDSIKVKNQKFNYIENIVIVEIFKKSENDVIIGEDEVFFNEYILRIRDDVENEIEISIGKANPELLYIFLKNLEFEYIEK